MILIHLEAEFDARGENTEACHRFGGRIRVRSTVLRCNVVEVKNET
jgi:hypothetical protein